MRMAQHILTPIPHVLAASVLVLGLTAGAEQCFARGGGGSHGSSFHSSIMRGGGAASPAGQTSFGQSFGHMPGGQITTGAPTAPTNTTSTISDPRHGQPGSDPHHHHPPPPPGSGSGTPTTTGSGVVVVPDTTPQNTLPNVAPAESAAAVPATPTTTTATPPSVGLTQDATVATSGGTLAPVLAGGGGDTLPACMALWDVSTHMTKVEWHDTCVRTLNGMDIGGGVTTEGGQPSNAIQASTGGRRATTARVIRQRQRPNPTQ